MVDVDEKQELDWDDLTLLVRHRAPPGDERARKIVLVGRLQRALKLEDRDIDGLYGPRTHTQLRVKELRLGKELSAIVRAYHERRYRS